VHTICVLTAAVDRIGCAGLYRGYSITALGYLPSGVLYYTTYEYGKYAAWQVYQRISHGRDAMVSYSTVEPLVHMSMGALAELTSASVWIPVDIVAQKMMVSSSLRYRSALGISPTCTHLPTLSLSLSLYLSISLYLTHTLSLADCHVGTIKSIWYDDGIRGFYRGFGATTMTFAFQSACCWAAYEQWRKFFYRHYPENGLLHTIIYNFGQAGIVRPIPKRTKRVEQSMITHTLSLSLSLCV
jgi:hypothetical protein